MWGSGFVCGVRVSLSNPFLPQLGSLTGLSLSLCLRASRRRPSPASSFRRRQTCGAHFLVLSVTHRQLSLPLSASSSRRRPTLAAVARHSLLASLAGNAHSGWSILFWWVCLFEFSWILHLLKLVIIFFGEFVRVSLLSHCWSKQFFWEFV